MEMNNLTPMLMLVVLFMVVSHPKTYEFTAGLVNMVLPDVDLVDENGCPTMMGQVLHAVVLVLLVWVVNNHLLEGEQRILH
tara:strand:+ start:641 stop:883 length:243 start_codon:yes stop_codon:yes gene_type:complete